MFKKKGGSNFEPKNEPTIFESNENNSDVSKKKKNHF